MSNYSNSPLATYVRLSPNHSGLRTHEIDTFSIHTMAGNLSVQTCGELFAQPSREASSNYGIDSAGTIALYVEEQNRSWCTSNKANDQRAITIEVASINTTDWRPSDAAYASLIKLLVDCCRRNNIEKLLWQANQNLIGQVDKQNITCHRWFKAKACPGDWFYDHMGQIVAAVNAALSASGTEHAEPDITEGSDVAAKLPEELVWEFLDNKGLSDYAKGGLMGNLFAESGFQANNLQNSFEAKLHHTDESYTMAVDNGSYTNFIRDGAGYGLAQWTYWSRKEALLNYAKSKGKSIGDFYMQLDFMWDELNKSYNGLMTTLASVTSLKEASDAVLIKFENPGGYGNNMPESIRNKRLGYAQSIYDRYATAENRDPATTVTKFPYTIKITTSALNIRKGPGTNNAKTGCIRDYGVYTIVEEAQGPGANLWGKLKSGAGWVAIDSRWNKKVS